MSEAAAAPGVEPALDSLERFGYKQELKRSLGLVDLTAYGLVLIGLTAPFAYFGIVYNASRGMVPLVFAVSAIAMSFTALSYVTMSRAFPIAGSVYAYAGRGISGSVGFLAGWAMLLDYLLLPTLVYVVIAVAIEAVVPAVPRFLSIILLLGLTTAVNLRGVETAARMNQVFLVLQVAFLVLFLALAGWALANGVAGAHLSTAPLFRPSEFSGRVIFGALPVAVVAYLGFDGISTLAEEARGGGSAVGRATLLALCLAGLLFVVETYLLSLFVLDQGAFLGGDATDAAVYTIAGIIGGTWFKVAASFKVLLSTAAAPASQAATARLLFSMARDGNLPRALASVHPIRRIPERALLLCAAINLFLGFAFANRLELLTTLISFGALLGFLALHLSVIVHFTWRHRSPNWPRHLLIPVLGFGFIAYALVNMARLAMVAGSVWMAAGIAALVALKRAGRRNALPAWRE